jgi:phosphoribosyl-ATP pyrophosphohydrolase
MNIFDRNYKAVVNRGLITKRTKNAEFYFKLIEECDEAVTEMLKGDFKKMDLEIADVMVVCSNWLIHRGVNIEYILTKIAEKNEKRAKKKLH